MVVAQGIIAAAQIIYAAVSSRSFSSTTFGGFAAAISLQGLISLVTTSGLPSFVFRSEFVGSADRIFLRQTAACAGLLGALLYGAISLIWLPIFGPSGGEFTPLMMLSQFFAALAGVESAIMRRESHPVRDAVALGSASVGGVLIGLGLVLTLKSSWVLAASTVLIPVLLWAFSFGMRSRVAGSRSSVSARSITASQVLSYAVIVTRQNIGFFGIQQSPIWGLGLFAGSAPLGEYSRAATMTNTSFNALSAALLRGSQAQWRHLATREDFLRRLREVLAISLCAAFTPFAVLAVVGHDLLLIWLGDTWTDAADVVWILACATAAQVVFTVAANAAELRAMFSEVRTAQLWMLGGLVVPLIGLAVFRQLEWAGIAALASQATGLIYLLLALADRARRGMLLSLALRQVVVSGIVALFAGAVLCMVNGLGWRFLFGGRVTAICTALLVAVVVALVTLPLSPAHQVLLVRSRRYAAIWRSIHRLGK